MNVLIPIVCQNEELKEYHIVLHFHHNKFSVHAIKNIYDIDNIVKIPNIF